MKHLFQQQRRAAKRAVDDYPAAIPQTRQLIKDTYSMYLGVLEMKLDNGTITEKKYTEWEKKYSTIKNIQLKKLEKIVGIKPLYKMMLKCRSDLKRAMRYAGKEADKDNLLYESKLHANTD